jgi:anti-sigma factor RsiW
MNTARFEELLLAYEDDALTPEELAEFKQLLASSPHARQRLVEAGVMQSIAASHVMSAPIIEMPQRNSSWMMSMRLGSSAA